MMIEFVLQEIFAIATNKELINLVFAFSRLVFRLSVMKTLRDAGLLVIFYSSKLSAR